MIKSDRWIRQMSETHGLIEPFVDKQVQKGVISFGVGGYGYDMRLANKFRILQPPQGVADPKQAQALETIDVEADQIVIEPNMIVWGQTLEYFRIPADVPSRKGNRPMPVWG